MKRAILTRKGQRKGSDGALERAQGTLPDYRYRASTNRVEARELAYGWTNPDTKRPHRIDNPDTDPETVNPQEWGQ